MTTETDPRDAEITRLREHIARLERYHAGPAQDAANGAMEVLAKQANAADERIRLLESALNPFAEHADHYRISDIPQSPPRIVGHYFVTTEELRIARAALGPADNANDRSTT